MAIEGYDEMARQVERACGVAQHVRMQSIDGNKGDACEFLKLRNGLERVLASVKKHRFVFVRAVEATKEECDPGRE